MTTRPKNAPLRALTCVPSSEPVGLPSRADASFHRGWFWISGGPVHQQQTLHAELSQYGVARIGSLQEARQAIASDPGRWAGIVVLDAQSHGSELGTFKRSHPKLALLALNFPVGRAVTHPFFDDGGFTSEQRASITSFARYALARAFVPDEHVASIVESLARKVGLTAREVQLLCFSLGDEPRPTVLKRLGISDNTLKTQVRGLLSKAGQPTVDTLATNVLREALLLKRRTLTPRELCLRAG